MSSIISLSHYSLVRHLTIVCIISLIVFSVYYLNMSLEFLKRLIDQIEEADIAFNRHAAKNLTVSKMIIEPLQRSAHDMYQKHEPSIVMNIISYTALIVLSFSGLVVTLRKHAVLLVLYGLGLDVVYSSSFLYVSRLKSWICAFVVFVSILSYIHARQIWRQQSANKVRILKATSSDHELIKDSHRDQYKYEHTSESV